jgi:ribonuclease-3
VDEFSELRAFQERLGYFFRDGELLKTALRHTSFAYENGLSESNQRLEFLGDAVLGLITAHILYELRPSAAEGKLSSFRAALVCKEALVRWAERLGLACVVMTGKSLRRSSPSVLADAVEAVLGAVYLDGGYDAAVRTIRRYLLEPGASLPGDGEPDAKSSLQNLLQAADMGLPRYQVLSVTGPSHAPQFRVFVYAAGRTWEGEGPSRKAAEAEAAAAALTELDKEGKAPRSFV